MKRVFSFAILAIFTSLCAYSQATFTSKTNGAWNSPTSWNLVSGTSTTNYPGTSDSAIIQGGNTIQLASGSQCQNLTVKGASFLRSDAATNTLTVSNNVLVTEASSMTITAGILTFTGNLTVNLASTLTQNGGVISVVGLMFVTSPLATGGTTLLDIDNGVFSCVGGLTVTATTIPAGRFAKLRIGSSSVNIAGALTTITGNSKLNFTGIGTLTLAGIISIASSGFTAGNGRVIYVGIPGTSQAIAPLTYNRLTIAGIGSGIKTINGNVVVTDTLSLLTDTLQINSGSLTLSNNAAIVKTAGALLSTPTFAGQLDLVYNNLQHDITGSEMPVNPATLRNLLLNNASGLGLANNITVNGKLSLQNGELATGNFTLMISNAAGATTDPAVERTNGYVSGKISRMIGTSTGARLFPFGKSATQGYREFKIDYTVAPVSAGVLTVQHINSAASAQSGFPLLDGGMTLLNTSPYYWQADASGGLAGGSYNMLLTAEGTNGVTDASTLRIVKRSSAGGNWVLDGIAGTNSGSNTAPVVARTGMSGFSQFTIAGNSVNVLPLALLDFRGALAGNSISLSWVSSNERNLAYFAIEKSEDGVSFIEISKVMARNGTANGYQYADAHVQYKKSYYRLKMVDLDGNYSYSKIVAFSLTRAGNLMVSPTVASSFINIISGERDINLYNGHGQLVKKLVAGVNNINQLPNGVYYVRTSGEVVRLIKQ